MFKVLFEHGLFGMILISFSVIFVQIEISSEILIQNYVKRCKRFPHCVPNSPETTKMASSRIIGKLTIKFSYFSRSLRH